MAAILRKITVKSVAGSVDVEKLIKADNKRLQLAKIFGTAYKMTPQESALGPYVKFSGRFRAVNADGEIFDAPSLIVPGIAQDMLIAALDQEGVNEVQFAIEISVKYEPTSVTKYVYEIKPLIEAASDDPIERLTAQLGIKKVDAIADQSEKPAGKGGKK